MTEQTGQLESSAYAAVAHAQAQTFGNTTTINLFRVESFEYDPVRSSLAVNLVSGRQHVIGDERAHPLYLELCDAYDIPQDVRAPKGSRDKRNGDVLKLNDDVENPPPAIRGGTAIPPGIRRGAEIGEKEAANARR